MARFSKYIIDPVIVIIFAAGFFLFVWGLVEFLMALNDDARGQRHGNGQRHMIWGIIGMFIMISVWGILNLLDNTFGLDFRNPDVTRANDVTAPGLFGP